MPGISVSRKKLAFSLVELLVALIAVSCIIAAFAPVMTKRMNREIGIVKNKKNYKLFLTSSSECQSYSSTVSCSFTVPNGVTKLHAVLVSAGSGGGGAALGNTVTELITADGYTKKREVDLSNNKVSSLRILKLIGGGGGGGGGYGDISGNSSCSEGVIVTTDSGDDYCVTTTPAGASGGPYIPDNINNTATSSDSGNACYYDSSMSGGKYYARLCNANAAASICSGYNSTTNTTGWNVPETGVLMIALSQSTSISPAINYAYTLYTQNHPLSSFVYPRRLIVTSGGYPAYISIDSSGSVNGVGSLSFYGSYHPVFCARKIDKPAYGGGGGAQGSEIRDVNYSSMCNGSISKITLTAGNGGSGGLKGASGSWGEDSSVSISCTNSLPSNTITARGGAPGAAATDAGGGAPGEYGKVIPSSSDRYDFVTRVPCFASIAWGGNGTTLTCTRPTMDATSGNNLRGGFGGGTSPFEKPVLADGSVVYNAITYIQQKCSESGYTGGGAYSPPAGCAGSKSSFAIAQNAAGGASSSAFTNYGFGGGGGYASGNGGAGSTGYAAVAVTRTLKGAAGGGGASGALMHVKEISVTSGQKCTVTVGKGGLGGGIGSDGLVGGISRLTCGQVKISAGNYEGGTAGTAQTDPDETEKQAFARRGKTPYSGTGSTIAISGVNKFNSFYKNSNIKEFNGVLELYQYIESPHPYFDMHIKDSLYMIDSSYGYRYYADGTIETSTENAVGGIGFPPPMDFTKYACGGLNQDRGDMLCNNADVNADARPFRKPDIVGDTDYGFAGAGGGGGGWKKEGNVAGKGGDGQDGYVYLYWESP